MINDHHWSSLIILLSLNLGKNSSQAGCLLEPWAWSQEDRLLHVLPLHHTHGRWHSAKKRENNIKWSWDWKCLLLFRIGQLPPLPSHCGRLCHHVGLLFCRQGWRKIKMLLILKIFSGLGDSLLWRGSNKPVLCSANHLCQGETLSVQRSLFPHTLFSPACGAPQSSWDERGCHCGSFDEEPQTLC